MQLYKTLKDEEITKLLFERWTMDKQSYDIITAGQRNKKPFQDFATYRKAFKGEAPEQFSDAEKEKIQEITDKINARLGR